MRRFRDRQSSRMFRGNEFGRLMTMIGMLFVLAMIIRRAGDAHTWQFLTGESDRELAAAEPATGPVDPPFNPPVNPPVNDASPMQPPADPSASTDAQRNNAPEPAAPAAGQPEPETPEATSLDEDEEELGAIANEFAAMTDRSPMAKEDMFAYWRLLRWSENAKLSEMLKRARTDVRFGDLILEPVEHRGELIKVRLHLIQLRKETAAPDNPLGLETYYQAVGWNNSQAWFYFCVFVDLPPGMPVADYIAQEGTFVGYFLKTITYQSAEGKTIQAPVLIGRMQWHPNPLAKRQEEDWRPAWWIGGLLLAGFAVRTAWRFGRGKKREPLTGLLRGRASSDEPTESIEDWLERASSAQAEVEINRAEHHESNGSGNGHSRRLPLDPRLDQSDEPGG
jgi:hypothetical protein